MLVPRAVVSPDVTCRMTSSESLDCVVWTGAGSMEDTSEGDGAELLSESESLSSSLSLSSVSLLVVAGCDACVCLRMRRDLHRRRQCLRDVVSSSSCHSLSSSGGASAGFVLVSSKYQSRVAGSLNKLVHMASASSLSVSETLTVSKRSS